MTSIPDETAISLPRVTLTVLARHPEQLLPFYLMCIDAIDYPKHLIALYVRAITETGQTADTLSNWLDRVRRRYALVDFDPHISGAPPDRTIGEARHQSIQFALHNGSDFYFVVDSDNFLKPTTLLALIEPRLPIVAPLLRHQDDAMVYANYHAKVDQNGFYLESDEYYWLLSQRIAGLCQVQLVNGSYLIRRDAIPHLSYQDDSGRPDYVVFSDSARRQGVPQFLDNRQVYGYVTVGQAPSLAIARMGEQVAISARNADMVPRGVRCRGAAGAVGSPPVFIHSSWRTASTWFWTKFRKLPSTLAFYEPFTLFLETITRADALTVGNENWASGHPNTDAYFLEYIPLIQRSGRVRLFDRRITFGFMPEGGLLGNLRSEEHRYVAFLLREAERRDRVPVFGLCRSLGRISAIKREFGGLHVFLFRNLWRQWASYVRFKRRGDGFFSSTIPLIVNRTDDPFLRHLADFYMKRSPDGRGDAEIDALIGTTEGYHVLASLPEPDMFAMFMSMHVYLYLHAQLCADLVVDVSRIARDPAHRAKLERDLRERAGLPIRLDDIRDENAARPDIDIAAIAWDEIYYHGEIAARTLAPRASFEDLSATAVGLILAAQKETSRQSGDA